MKRKYIIIVILLVSGLLTMQSCTKETLVPIKAYVATVPANPTPALDAVLPFTASAPINLKWDQGTGKANSWDILIVSPDDTRTKATSTTNSYTFTPTMSGLYVWNVNTKDPNGITSTSVTLSGDSWNFFLNTPPYTPVLNTPAANAVNFSVTGALTWTANDDETPDELTYDVYLGKTETPGAVATNLTAATYSPTLAASTLYYWKVVAKDPQGASTASAIGSFTTGVEAIMKYTGAYTVDEPAEGWTYPVNLSKGSATTLKIDQYWASWPAVFTVDIAKLTYAMALTTFTSGYSAIEQGTIDPATGALTGAYTIWQNGKVIEQGFHTYTKN